MWSLAKGSVMIAAYLVATGTATAAGTIPVDMFKPFVMVKMPEASLDLGYTYGPGIQMLEAHAVAHVVANCPYHLKVSFGGLRHQEGKASIADEDMSVTINGKAVVLGKTQVPIVTSGRPTPRNGTDVPIDMQVAVKRLVSYPAGQYGGTLVVTIMAGP